MVKRITFGVISAVAVCFPTLIRYFGIPALPSVLACILLFVLFIYINVLPEKKIASSKRLNNLSAGCELLRIFIITTALAVLWHSFYAYCSFKEILPWGDNSTTLLLKWIGLLALTVIACAVIFWNGMIRVYLTSVQLGIKHRVIAAVLGLVPIANIYYLFKIISVCSDEVRDETARIELDSARAESEICKTKYPVLLVHGVFFRDFRYLNYWGRIPAALIKNGAEIYYGGQQSAVDVYEAGRELAEKIREITEKTGCEKVNIIAHSKGGLDCRAAITHFGADKMVASLTTINTPHNGCIFAEYLLKTVPAKVRNALASGYNAALLKLGDTSPDFLGAVNCLTETACKKFNEETPDMDGVLYESVMSYCKKAKSGKFPLNVSYPLVKHFDGQNDGLVALGSAKWGSSFKIAAPTGRRGISHGDMIDLNRENIKGFDVREFYVTLVSELSNRGY